MKPVHADVAGKIQRKVIDEGVCINDLRKLLKDFSPEERLSIANDVVTNIADERSVALVTGFDPRRMRELAYRLRTFGAFMLDSRRDGFLPRDHRPSWRVAADTIYRTADNFETDEQLRKTYKLD